MNRKVMAKIKSTNSMKTVELINYNNNKDIIVEYNDKRYKATYSTISGKIYVDDSMK